MNLHICHSIYYAHTYILILLPLCIHIYLSTYSASRIHALLVVEIGRGPILIDLQSANKTYIDDKELTPFTSYPLLPTSIVKFGGDTKSMYTFDVNTTYDITKRDAITQRISNTPTTTTTSTSTHQHSEEENSIFIGSIPIEVTEQQLIQFFSVCGEIKKIVYPKDKVTNQPRGTIFIIYYIIPY